MGGCSLSPAPATRMRFVTHSPRSICGSPTRSWRRWAESRISRDHEMWCRGREAGLRCRDVVPGSWCRSVKLRRSTGIRFCGVRRWACTVLTRTCMVGARTCMIRAWICRVMSGRRACTEYCADLGMAEFCGLRVAGREVNGLSSGEVSAGYGLIPTGCGLNRTG